VSLRGAVDGLLEASVVGSFTRVGYDVRSRLYDWTPLGELRLDGKTAAVTGATSGLGRVAAELLARQGATVCIVGRDPERTARAQGETGAASALLADLSSMRETRALAEQLAGPLDVLVLNAGAMTRDFTLTDEGNEVTLATHVLSQFLLIDALRPQLEASGTRVIVVSSGGMYLERLDVDALQPTEATYDGVRAYSRAKRAQVALVEEWTRRLEHATVNAMHPGWADTPGLRQGLPRFSRALAPVLRSPAQGADTIVWLAAAPEAGAAKGEFFLDRRPRPIHRRRSTRRVDEAREHARLWELCVRLTRARSADA